MAWVGALGALVLVMLSGCSVNNQQMYYHTLTPVLAVEQEQLAILQPLELKVVAIPPQVDRSQLVIRLDGSHLQILENHWWGASLRDELHSALLNHLLTRPLVLSQTLDIRLRVNRFELQPGVRTVLGAEWRLSWRRAGPWPARSCSGLWQQSPEQPSIDAVVRAQQQNTANLAEAIRRSITEGCR